MGALIAIVAITRFAFRSHFLYDIDSVNYALGMSRFDPTVHQPHPPGYFLYVVGARLLQHIFHDANLSLVMLGVLAACGTAVLIYQLGRLWFDEQTALAAALLYVVCPLAWFYATIAMTYTVEGFFSALLGYLLWQVETGKTSRLLPAAVAFGVAAGVRPSGLLLLFPLFVYVMRRANLRQVAASAAALGATLLAVFVPMFVASGGFHRYMSSLLDLLVRVPSKDTIFNSSPINSIARLIVIGLMFLFTFGTFALNTFEAGRDGHAEDKRIRNFTLVWCLPGLCFFTFIYFKLVSSGYLLLLIAPACLWIGRWTVQWYRRSQWPKAVKLSRIALDTAICVATFLWAPLYCSYSSEHKFEANLKQVVAAIPQIGGPQDTLLIGIDSHFLGYRHAGYYLPQYQTIEYPEVKMLQGTRLFTMKDQQTQLMPFMPSGCFAHFVIFPLPRDSEDSEYMNKLTAKLNPADLRIVKIGAYSYVTGPVADLRAIFPVAGATLQSASGNTDPGCDDFANRSEHP